MKAEMDLHEGFEIDLNSPTASTMPTPVIFLKNVDQTKNSSSIQMIQPVKKARVAEPQMNTYSMNLCAATSKLLESIQDIPEDDYIEIAKRLKIISSKEVKSEN